MKTVALRILGIAFLCIILTVLLSSAYVGYFATTQPREVAVGAESIWCNGRYLHKLDARESVIDTTHLAVAKGGYLYALIGAYALQSNNQEGQEHFFELPSRVKAISALNRSHRESGFEANSFEVYDRAVPEKLSEIVIAFFGTNDHADWLASFSLDTTQYQQAVTYVQKVSAAYPGVSIVVTGYSLGGALAAHVAKHPRSRDAVRSAWLFNPSPKIWSDSGASSKIWQAATVDDILKIARTPIFRLLPGVADIGAPATQKAENYYLIQSNPVHAHFRWALARNILHSADLAFYKETNGNLADSEPLEILQRSRFKACPTP